MYYALLVLGIIYGLLNVLTGVVQFKLKDIKITQTILMILGGLLILVASILSHLSFNLLFVLIGGLLIIHVAAIMNGLTMHGKLNPLHHLIRLILSITLILLFIFK